VLKTRAFADGICKRTIDNIRRIQLLLDQAGAEIQGDGLLFAGDHAIVDRGDSIPASLLPVLY